MGWKPTLEPRKEKLDISKKLPIASWKAVIREQTTK